MINNLKHTKLTLNCTINSIIIIIICFYSGLSFAANKSVINKQKGIAPMNNIISLTVSPLLKNCIAGEQLLVRTSLTNKSDAVLILPDIFSNSPFIYEMKCNTETYRVSQQLSKNRSLGLDVEPTDIVMSPTEVQPGASIELTEDLTEYAFPHFAAGAYELSVTAVIQEKAIKSMPVSVIVEKVNPIAVVSTISPLNLTVSSFLAHTSLKGNVLYLQENKGPLATEGVFMRKLELPAEVKISGISIAEKVKQISEGQWIAWLADGSIFAARSWGTLFTPIYDLAFNNLEKNTLLQYGFQHDDNTVFFYTVGFNNGTYTLIEVKITQQGISENRRIPISDNVPQSIIVSQNKNGELFVIWLEHTQHQKSVVMKKVFPKNHGNNIVIYSSIHDLSSLYMQVWSDDPAVSFIEGPKKPTTHYTLLNLQALTPNNLEKTNFTVPNGLTAPVTANVVFHNQHVIAGALDKAVIWNYASLKEHWYVVNNGLSPALCVRFLAVAGNPPLIQWIDAENGLQFEYLKQK